MVTVARMAKKASFKSKVDLLTFFGNPLWRRTPPRPSLCYSVPPRLELEVFKRTTKGASKTNPYSCRKSLLIASHSFSSLRSR